MTGSSPATSPASRSAGTATATGPCDANVAGCLAGHGRRVHAARRHGAPPPSSSSWPSAISIPAIRPMRVAAEIGIPAATIRRIAAELAHAAFERGDHPRHPWTDWAGRRHDKMIGRPVSMHAMRGISAHSNGFHTCRAHPSAADAAGQHRLPRRLPLQAALPAPDPAAVKPAGESRPGKLARRARAGLSHRARRILLVEADGTPQRIDKAFSWEAPLAAHGLMHMVIRNAWAGDPYPDRHAVPLHGEHGLELVDEHRRAPSRC